MRFQILLGLIIAASSSPAFAQGAPPAPAAPPSDAPKPLAESLTGQAKEEYEAANLLFGDGDYAGAALKFQRAHELSKDPRLLWNMAATEKFLRHYTRVEALLRQYLAEGGASLTDADRADAQNLLDTIGTFLADVTVNVDQPGATIVVDDVELGTTPLAKPLRLDMGTRKFSVKKAGYKEFTATQNLEGGSTTTLDVKLVEEVHEGRLRITAEPGDTIRVDGKYAGTSQWEGRLASGPHRMEVSAQGMQTWRSESIVQDGQLTTVAVALTPVPKATESGLPAWAWVTGGVVAAAGLGAGAYFLFRPEDKGPPPATQGSFGTVELPFRL